ncbi:hypothetical protein [Qipengyuania sp. JC766]|uniref:DUF4168 domain-containing protein n=1 Tax=Qipengyuania sp. JC766 TaxID=3232139 RepID=UPI003457F045
MKTALSAMAFASLAMFAPTAAAQEAPAAPAPATEEMAPVSDAELEKWVRAASTMQQIQENAEMPQESKQQAMGQVLVQAEMTPARFNQIAAALQTSESLQTRVNETVARLQAQANG